MSANCVECKFGEPNYCSIKKIFTDRRGQVVKEEASGGQSLVVCRPPATVSGFPYRNRVAPLGYCEKGERK